MIPPESDKEFEDTTIKAVRDNGGDYYEIDKESWGTFILEKALAGPLVIKPGDSLRTYGNIRGVVINGVCVFYRTAEEERERFEIQTYGASPADLLKKWDDGKIVWTAQMGGMSPGYEQVIQITAFEILRYFIATNHDAEKERSDEEWQALDDELHKALSKKLEPLGLSGAQWGAACNLASMFYRKGPVAAIKSLPEDRRIMCQKHFPQLADAA